MYDKKQLKIAYQTAGEHSIGQSKKHTWNVP
jgi:hypothetical protein